jgi:transcriptional regulator with XRE-family HTH domain
MQRAKDETRQREVAARLRALRMELNYEQFEIAELVGISPQRWSYYENAKRQFDFDVAALLCDKVSALPGKRALTLDYIYRGEQKAGVPLGFYRKLQRHFTTNYDLLVEKAAERAKRRKKSTRAKGEKARAK